MIYLLSTYYLNIKYLFVYLRMRFDGLSVLYTVHCVGQFFDLFWPFTGWVSKSEEWTSWFHNDLIDTVRNNYNTSHVTMPDIALHQRIIFLTKQVARKSGQQDRNKGLYLCGGICHRASWKHTIYVYLGQNRIMYFIKKQTMSRLILSKRMAWIWFKHYWLA